MIHDHVTGSLSWHVKPILDANKFQQIIQNFRSLPGDRYLLYLHRKRGIYNFEDLKAGAPATGSPPTQKLLSGYTDKGLLAKAVFHLDLFAKGTRPSLAGRSQPEAWAALNDWQVDAIQELAQALPTTFS